MQHLQISQDDLIDVLEMTQDIEDFILPICRDNDTNISLSAIMNATINCIIAQCKSLNEIEFYKYVFMSLFDDYIKSIKVELSKNPPSS